ncbi:MAG: prepilin-type N-terminal cleavage/methylation domain-containing protein [Pirellula sp.]|nr:type II secretion system protein GspJ [Pirellula sp.]
MNCTTLRFNSHREKHTRNRSGFTLLELMLSLALTAVVTVLIGSLVQNYLINQAVGRERVRQAQLSRSILNMIAEDIRTTVRYQPFDTKGLTELLSGGGAAGGAGAGGTQPSGAGGGAASAGGAPPSGGAGDTTDMDTGVAALPPGLYGTSTSIEIDISRLPRPDEYYGQASDPVTGSLGDLATDIKTVGYYVQALRTDGIQDPLGSLKPIDGTNSTSQGVGGLVRRSVDRAITQYAYQQSQSDALMRTGQLLAPEVIAIEFQYFDGAMWQTEWDSSTQGLPRVVKITIAVQRESNAKKSPMEPGVMISSITSTMQAEYGIDIYSTNTIIPGSQLLMGPQSTDSGMSSMGL